MPDTEPSPDDRPIDLHKEGLVDRVLSLEEQLAFYRDDIIASGATPEEADQLIALAFAEVPHDELSAFKREIAGWADPDAEPPTPN